MEFFNLLSVTWLLLNSPSSPLGGDPSVNWYLLVESFCAHQRWLFAASHSPNSTRLLYSLIPVGFLQSFELISLCLFTRRELHLQTWRIEGLYLLRKLNGFKQDVRPISHEQLSLLLSALGPEYHIVEGVVSRRERGGWQRSSEGCNFNKTVTFLLFLWPTGGQVTATSWNTRHGV